MKGILRLIFTAAVAVLISVGVLAATPSEAVGEYVESMGDLPAQIEADMNKHTEQSEITGIAEIPSNSTYRMGLYYLESGDTAADIVSGAMTPTMEKWVLYAVETNGTQSWVEAEVSPEGELNSGVIGSYGALATDPQDCPPTYDELAAEIESAVGDSVDWVRLVSFRLKGQTDCFLISSGAEITAIVYYTDWEEPLDLSFFDQAPRTDRGHWVVDGEELVSYLLNTEAQTDGPEDAPQSSQPEPEQAGGMDLQIVWIAVGFLAAAILIVFVAMRRRKS